MYTISGINGYKYRSDLGSSPEGDIPLGYIGSPYSYMIAASYTHGYKTAGKCIYIISEFYISSGIIKLCISECILIGEFLTHPVKYVREGLIDQMIFRPYIFSGMSLIVLKKLLLFLTVCRHIVCKMRERDSCILKALIPAFYPL